MVIHHRLENALARAEELIAVGNQSVALQLLHDAIISRWFQHNLLALDAIMLKFVELCVELRRGRLAKDGLHQYRSLSQSVNVAGLEHVIGYFLTTAEAKLEAACKEAADAASVDSVEDLEQAPEEALALVWSSVEDVDRTGRAMITPWLRFVWESFRITLDICRHNAKLEGLYRVIVEKAFVFCRNYGRKAEFRRLCEILRHHLAIIVKYPGQPNGVQLQIAESHALQLELRFKQLDVATDMELWHEAFRSIEDIHGLFVLARKSAMPSLVITYYSRLCQVFQMANKHLYLAATLCKLFALSKSQDAGPDKMQIDATMTVLALLATPLIKERDVTNTMTEDEIGTKDTRLALFLGLQKIPTRSSVIRELHNRAILSQSDVEVQQLFTLLEERTRSNEIADQKDVIGNLLRRIEVNERYQSFVPSIYRNYVALVFAQISKKEKIISLDSLVSVISMPCVESLKSFNLDTFIIEGCQSDDFHLRIDHLRGIIQFQKPCFAPIPSLEINDVRKNKLVEISRLLESFVPRRTCDINVDAMIAEASALVEVEHQHNLARKGKIEKRKEQLEELQQRREKEEARERALKLQAEKETERVRLAEEAARREQLRKEQEKETIRRDQTAKREEEEQRKKEVLARRANLEKMIAVVKRLDHLERAYRQEEIPLLKDDYEKQKKIDRVAYEERSTLIKEKACAQHAADILLRNRLIAMTEDYKLYSKRVIEQRAVALAANQKKLGEELEEAKKLHREKVLAQMAARKEEECRKKLETEKAAAVQETLPESERKTPYVPPGKRNPTPQSGALESTRPSPFGSRSTSNMNSTGGSWRRQ